MASKLILALDYVLILAVEGSTKDYKEEGEGPMENTHQTEKESRDRFLQSKEESKWFSIAERGRWNLQEGKFLKDKEYKERREKGAIAAA